MRKTKHTSQPGRVVAKVARQLSLPAPLSFLLSINNPHPAPHLALQRPHARALHLLAIALNIVAHDERLTLHPPLHLSVLNPPNSLTRSATTTALSLANIRSVSTARAKQLNGLVHTHISGESGHLTLVDARVHRGIVVLVLR